ncbi:extracellular solute-binding protein [Parasalinivibrio latis]|uniref:ABC transporter substrate-binding protein n=1 Tax=Parasalinivibrio latis TaxID=2952610 RepID=UPI0030E3B287
MDICSKKRHLAEVVDRYVRGEMARRDFLRAAGKLGLGLGALALTRGMPFNPLNSISGFAFAADADKETAAWLKDVGKPFAGTTVKMATESTPPSKVFAELVKKEFTPATGINVEIELLPLEQVLQKLTLDVATGLGSYDLYYLDQSWIAGFSGDTVDPRELMETKKELAMPDYDMDDFLQPLVDGISMYKGKMVAIPYDIPLFITMYREDIYNELGLDVPTNLDTFLSNAQAITKAKAPGMYGTTGQMKSGHYSLECDWTAWLWGHGGSIFRPDGTFSGNDERGIEAMEYWMKLKQSMPSGVTTWTWDGQGKSIVTGKAAQVLSWGEFFPWFDNPKESVASGKMQAALPPQPKALRTPEEAGFGEIPQIGHQGGSGLALSKYSKHSDAAWVFMQWVTSSDVQTRASIFGGGASPMRKSTYEDPRIIEAAKIGAGTTRHFDVTRKTIETMMGSEPDMPAWPEISNDIIPVELGKFWAGDYKSPKEAMDVIARKVDKITKDYRS